MDRLERNLKLGVFILFVVTLVYAVSVASSNHTPLPPREIRDECTASAWTAMQYSQKEIKLAEAICRLQHKKRNAFN